MIMSIENNVCVHRVTKKKVFLNESLLELDRQRVTIMADRNCRSPSASFIAIMHLHEGLTHIQSQIMPRLLFGKSFTLTVGPVIYGARFIEDIMPFKTVEEGDD